MKIKMPCKLCEVTLDQHKLGVNGGACTHSSFLFGGQLSTFPAMGLGFSSNPFVLPQIRDVMLAYLLRGMIIISIYFIICFSSFYSLQ